MRNTTLALLAFTVLTTAACSSGSGSGSGGSTTGSTTDGATTSGSGGGATTGSGGSGSATTSSGTGGAAPEGTTITLNGLLCLDLATGATDSANPCKGDIVFLQGANVDLQSNGNVATFCAKPGTFQSLASIPKDYAACAWEPYVEGAVGLAKTGYVLRDAMGTHHYRFWIVDDMGSTITFQLEKID